MKNIQFLLVLIFISNPIFSQDKYAYVAIEDSLGKRSKGVMLNNGQEIILPKYEMVFRLNDYFLCKNENGYGIYSKSGSLIIEHQFENFGYGMSSGMFRVKKDGFWGFIKPDGKIIIPFEYEKACNFYDGKAYVFKNGQAYYINTKNEMVNIAEEILEYCDEDTDTASDWFSQFELEDDLKIKAVDQKFGVVNTKGEVIIPIIYDEVGDYENDIIAVRKGKLWGAYQNTGKLIVAPKYAYLGWFLNW